MIEANERGEKQAVVWRAGNDTREFLYVDDAAEGIVLATERYNESQPVNLGAGFEISVTELVSLIAKLTDYHGKIVWDKTNPEGQPRRMIDTEKAFIKFDFKAKTGFGEGLKTIDWYRRAYGRGRKTGIKNSTTKSAV